MCCVGSVWVRVYGSIPLSLAEPDPDYLMSVLLQSGGHSHTNSDLLKCKPNDTSVESMQSKCIRVKQKRVVTHNHTHTQAGRGAAA